MCIFLNKKEAKMSFHVSVKDPFYVSETANIFLNSLSSEVLPLSHKKVAVYCVKPIVGVS